MRRLLSSLVLFAILSCSPGIIYAKPVPITAKSWLVADEQGHIIQGENTNAVRPIASISKLVTAMVVLDAKQNPNEQLGQYTRNQLLQMMLVKSDNQAAVKLCDNYPGGRDECVRAMNNKVRAMGLENTRFIEPTGLSIMNISTATELIQIVLAAKEYTEINYAAKTSEVKIKIRKKWLVFRNTNPIIGHRHNFLVSKTGFINASGGCIVMMLDTEVGRRIVVVLGSKNTRTRIPEAEFISQK
jgi:D-alanyl-D-alanine endopeptidase (penicillin-binding protein 7)